MASLDERRGKNGSLPGASFAPVDSACVVKTFSVCMKLNQQCVAHSTTMTKLPSCLVLSYSYAALYQYYYGSVLPLLALT